jgi:hypothetical protein
MIGLTLVFHPPGCFWGVAPVHAGLTTATSTFDSCNDSMPASYMHTTAPTSRLPRYACDS